MKDSWKNNFNIDEAMVVLSVIIFLIVIYFSLPAAPQKAEAKEPAIKPIPLSLTIIEAEPEPMAAIEEKPIYIIDATDEEKDLMARVVMSEASILPIEGKQAVAQTIVNRFLSQKFPNNITEVCNQPYQYSQQDNGDPDAECYEAVEAALMYEAFPRNMLYFRTGYYHPWAADYIQIGNTYFSLEPDE